MSEIVLPLTILAVALSMGLLVLSGVAAAMAFYWIRGQREEALDGPEPIDLDDLEQEDRDEVVAGFVSGVGALDDWAKRLWAEELRENGVSEEEIQRRLENRETIELT